MREWLNEKGYDVIKVDDLHDLYVEFIEEGWRAQK